MAEINQIFPSTFEETITTLVSSFVANGRVILQPRDHFSQIRVLLDLKDYEDWLPRK